MNIGEKIRSLRMAKLMTQSELAGNQITRNMLSCIENGKAQPSLSTVLYIAERLNVPVGFLLAEKGDEIVYRKMNSMANIKRAYKAGALADCRNLCLLLYPDLDDEILLLLAECDFGLAKDAFRAGRLHHSCRLFDEALKYAEETLYPVPHIYAETNVYFRFMGKISPLLVSEVMDETRFVGVLPQTPFSEYLHATEALEAGNTVPADGYEQSFPDEQSFFIPHLKIRKMMCAGNYSDARIALLERLHAEIPLNEIELYVILQDLEIACRETEDYKGAYQYANEKRQLLELLLKDE